MPADVGKYAEALVKIGQRNPAVPAVQVELIRESQRGAFKSEVGITSPSLGSGDPFLLGAQGGAEE